MSLNLFVPQTGVHKDSSVKDLIVLILSSEFPLRLKRIHSLLTKKYGCNTTFQATYKAVSDLLEKGVVVKAGKEYSLNKSWIVKLNFFASDLEKSYQSDKGFPVIEENDNLSLNFDALADVDRFVLAKLEAYPEEREKVRVVAFLSHLWWPMFYSFREYLQLKEISRKMDLSIYCVGNTALDKWCAKYYSAIGIKVETGAKHSHQNDLIVFKDYVIQIFYPKKVLNEMSKVFSKYNKVDQLCVPEFYSKIFEKRVNVQLLINRNPLLSKELFSILT